MNRRTSVIIACLIMGALGFWFACGRSAAKEAAYPVENGRRGFTRAVCTRVSGLFNGARVAAENQRLRDENDALKMVRLEADALARENAHLRGLLALGTDGKPLFPTNRWLCAPVLSRGGAAGVRGLLRVGRGSLDGVTTNAAVAVPAGLVGRVDSVSPRTADVRLVISPSVRVACDVETGDPDFGAVRGIVEGGGARAVRPEAGATVLYILDPLRVRHLKRHPRLPARARLITNGLGGLYPPGLTVGFLMDGQDEGELELEREGDVQPAVDFPSLEHVFIRRED